MYFINIEDLLFYIHSEIDKMICQFPNAFLIQMYSFKNKILNINV